jgi:hypothetical protein
VAWKCLIMRRKGGYVRGRAAGLRPCARCCKKRSACGEGTAFIVMFQESSFSTTFVQDFAGYLFKYLNPSETGATRE